MALYLQKNVCTIISISFLLELAFAQTSSVRLTRNALQRNSYSVRLILISFTFPREVRHYCQTYRLIVGIVQF